MLDTVTIEPPGPVQASVIWMHGLGADGHDFEPIVPHLGVQDLGIRFVFPHAPTRPVTVNGGMAMRAWYDIRALQIDRQEDEEGVRDSETAIRDLVAAEIARGLAPARIVLAGFSQGGAMALHAGLRYPETLAGILALSCYLPLAQSVSAERHSCNQDTPVFLAHGSEDPVVPMALGHVGYQQLKALGYPVIWHDYRMGHEVNLEEIRGIGSWLIDLLG